MIRALVLSLALSVAVEARAEELRRFALVAGNDDGGRDTRPLLYARQDARKLHEILTRLGGVRREDSVLLLNEGSEAFLRALSDLERRARDASRDGQRTALFVYYSGHAKHGALRLGSSTIPFESLKSRLAQAPADVRIGVFDACQSGALTRTKGARKAPAFDIESEPKRDARGLVILTSSASDEDSQESDAIGGSYFSHHLASGLLGDADRSADGRVTLAEAYAYAYDRTVADTAESQAGAQHPTFSYDLAGNGDVVVTDLTSRSDGVHFPASAPAGVYYLVDAKGFVAAEVWKAEGAEKRISIAPGSYKVKRRLDDRLRIGELQVVGGRFTGFDEGRMHDAPFSDDPVKGAGGVRAGWGLLVSGGYQSFFESGDGGSLFPRSTAVLGVEAELRDYFRRDWTLGFDFSIGASNASLALDGVLLPYRFTQTNLGTGLTAEFPFGDWAPFVGARLSLLVLTRDFDDPLLPLQSLYTLSPGLSGGVSWRFGPRLQLLVRGRVHYLPYFIDQNRSLGYWELSTAVGYAL
jgi:hypothetical protein